MPRRKELSWIMKEAIWDLAMKHGSRPEVISNELDRIRRNDDRFIEQITPDPRTIKKVIVELQSIDVHKVALLPKHIWHLRNDYELIKDELDRITGRPSEFASIRRTSNGAIITSEIQQDSKQNREKSGLQTINAEKANFRSNILSPIYGPIIGRSPELEKFRRLIGGTEAGEGQLVFVSGPAGSGKSRLIQEFVTECSLRQFIVLQTRCTEFHVEMPFLPFKDIFEKLFEIVIDDREQTRKNKIEGCLTKINPELLYLIHNIVPFIDHAVSLESQEIDALKERVNPTVERDKFFFAMLSLLKGYSKLQPLVICIDDLQRADSGTLDLLQFITSHLKEMRLMIVTTYRSEDVGFRDGKLTLMNQTRRQLVKEEFYHEIRLSELSKEFTDQLIDSVVPDHSFDDKFKQAVFTETKGNPLFVISVVRSLIDSKRLIKDDKNGKWVLPEEHFKIELPDTVEEVIRGQIERLRYDERLEIEKASVLGTEFLFRILKNLSDRNEDELIDYLQNYVDYQLIMEVDPREEKFIFNHGKIRDVIYESISALRRRRLHQKVAAVLESAYSDRLEQIAPVLAIHHDIAGNNEAAIDYLIKSARINARVHNNEEASRNIARACELLNLMNPCEKKARFTASLCLEEGNVQKNKTEYEMAGQKYTECIELAETVCDELIKAWAIDNLADILHIQGKYEEAEIQYLKVDQIATKLENQQLHIEALADLGELYYRMSIRYAATSQTVKVAEVKQKAKDCLVQVLEIASRLNDFVCLCRAYNYMGVLYEIERNYEKAEESYETCLKIAKDHKLSLCVLDSLGDLYRQKNDFDGALQYYREFADYCKAKGSKLEEAISCNNMGMVYARQGLLDKAIECYDKSLEYNKEVGFEECMVESYIMKGLSLEQQKHHEQAMANFREGLLLIGNLSESDTKVDIIKKIAEILRARGEFATAEYLLAQ